MKSSYISVDVEGSVGRADGIMVLPPETNMISIGACLIGDPRIRFYAELSLINENWNDQAQAIHGISREHLAAKGQDPRTVMEAFAHWTRRVAAGRVPVFCATPIAYDWECVRWYFQHLDVPNPYRETLDGRDLYRRIKGLERHEKVPRMQIWNEFPTTLPHTHNALDDALEQEEVFRQMLVVAGSL